MLSGTWQLLNMTIQLYIVQCVQLVSLETKLCVQISLYFGKFLRDDCPALTQEESTLGRVRGRCRADGRLQIERFVLRRPETATTCTYWPEG